jgi:hypothetical protein
VFIVLPDDRLDALGVQMWPSIEEVVSRERREELCRPVVAQRQWQCM